MMLTPTYHVYDMYKVHHDAEMLPVDMEGPDYAFEEQSLPAVSTIASRREDGKIHLSAVNIDKERSMEVIVSLEAEEVLFREFADVKIKGKQVLFTLSAHSIVMLEIR